MAAVFAEFRAFFRRDICVRIFQLLVSFRTRNIWRLSVIPSPFAIKSRDICVVPLFVNYFSRVVAILNWKLRPVAVTVPHAYRRARHNGRHCHLW